MCTTSTPHSALHLCAVLPEDEPSLALLCSLLSTPEEVQVVDMAPGEGNVLFRHSIASRLEHSLHRQHLIGEELVRVRLKGGKGRRPEGGRRRREGGGGREGKRGKGRREGEEREEGGKEGGRKGGRGEGGRREEEERKEEREEGNH